MTELESCDYYRCNRPFTCEDGWSNRWCYGHSIVASANADTHGEFAITVEQYKERIAPARQWFKDNQNEQ